MQYYRCKCGNRSAYGSMPPYPCDKCDKCGSNLALHPDYHQEPKSHDFSSVSEVETDQGKATITRCRWCSRTSAEVERMKVETPNPYAGDEPDPTPPGGSPNDAFQTGQQ